MIPSETTPTYGFWDGDYTFHRVLYDNRSRDYTMRVRIDNNPEQRALENIENHNHGLPGWSDIRVATDSEIKAWFRLFAHQFPLRDEAHTQGLRRLKLQGSATLEDIPVVEGAALLRLTFPVVCVRDFRPTPTRFVEIVDDQFLLTEDGRWLTTLMK